MPRLGLWRLAGRVERERRCSVVAALERTMKRLMAEQGVRSAAEPHRLLVADGVEISYERVRRYLSGGWRRRRERNIVLNWDVARVLGLSAQQKARMAWPDLEA